MPRGSARTRLPVSWLHGTQYGPAMTTSRRVALITDASNYVGPHLARLLAAAGHDLVVGDPQAGLVDELEAAGATVATVASTRDLSDPDAVDRLVTAARE